MKKLGKFLIGMSMTALLSLGLVACGDGDGSSSASSSKKPTPSASVSVDTTPEDDGVKKDNIFEAEAAEYTGVSSNNSSNFGHACISKSYVFDTSFSGNLSIRNLAPNSNGDGDNPSSANNSVTFKFTSDKAVKVTMEVKVASRFDQPSWSAMNFSQMYTTEVNGTTLSADAIVPQGNAQQIVQGNNYTAMQLIELPISLKEGENVIVFKAQSKACNLDYINIKTSATLTGWTDHFWAGVEELITVTKDPTLTATGTITFGCEENTSGHTQNWTMPMLNADDYEVDDSAADKIVYSITVAGEEFTFEVAK